MQDQPRYEVYESSKFFDDGQGSRPLVEGTVPRGAQFRDPDAYQYSGKTAGGQPVASGNAAGGGNATGAQPGGVSNAGANAATGVGGAQTPGDVNVRGANVAGGLLSGDKSAQGANLAGGNRQANGQATGAGAQQGGPDVFPFPIDAAALNRGEERFNIYCSMCHGMTGDADGMIVRRGFRRPPSFHEDRLQAGEASAAHFFDVITNGWGAMPDYAAQIPWEDRWRIIAYVRALQLSRRTSLADLPPDVRERIEREAAQHQHAGATPEAEHGGTHR